MTKKLLIFTHSASGHHPEYLHHLYMGILERENLSAIIVVPESFQKRNVLFEWPPCERVTFDFIPDEKVSWGDGKWYKRNLRFAKLVRYYTQKHHPSEVFMIDPMMCMPYLAFMVPSGIKVSGILYEIYQYRWQALSLPRKLAALAWHWLLAKRSCFKTLFLLNDAEVAEHDNRIYHTYHFRYLPDPFMPLPQTTVDFRKKYDIPKEKKLLFHFGSFGHKKGTLQILKSALALSPVEQSKYCFVFAGCVQPIIHDEFYKLIDQLKTGTAVQVIVFDEFCSYEFLAGWCAVCSAILVPYLEAYNSSGCIGYAAQFNKPVIGPTYGLLGKLIKDYALGIQMSRIDTPLLLKAYQQIDNYPVDGSAYLSSNMVKDFCQKILS